MHIICVYSEQKNQVKDLINKPQKQYDEIYNGYQNPIFEYRTPMMKDAENNEIIVNINSTENIPCGCLEVYEDEETNTIIFKVDKTLLKSEDEGFHEIGISFCFR